MNVVRYHVCSNENLRALIKEVNKYIISEWQPLGGVVVNNTGTKVEYVQAVVQYEKVTE